MAEGESSLLAAGASRSIPPEHLQLRQDPHSAPVAPLGGRREHSVVGQQMDSGARYQGGEPRDEVERIEA
jgi:hypothetical protein